MLPMSAQAKNGNGHAATAEHEPQADPEPPHSSVLPGADLRQRIDQMGTILAKGLDLAEAGVSLGVTIISRVGVAAQQKLREGLDATAAQTSPVAEQQQPDGAPATEPEYGITNRLPLAPGGTVRISFSVNNDSMTEPKKVDLRVEGFAGDSHGGALDASSFAIKPAQKNIAPVDFEKFVLQGSVPADAAPDIYRGAVVVDSGNAFRIPVVLVVMPL
jgi:hypothetical protein